MDVAERVEALAIMAQNMKKLDPANFASEPVSGFIDALSQDLKNIAEEWLSEED